MCIIYTIKSDYPRLETMKLYTDPPQAMDRKGAPAGERQQQSDSRRAIVEKRLQGKKSERREATAGERS